MANKNISKTTTEPKTSLKDKVNSGIDKLKSIYSDRVTKGSFDDGAKYVRYENGNKNAGIFSGNDSKAAYYNNEDGTSAFARKFNGENNYYVGGLSNPNWNIPEGSRSMRTPLGTVEMGSAEGDGGETGYIGYTSPIGRSRNVMPNGDVYDNFNYAPTDNSYAYANRESLANGDRWYTAGVQTPILNGEGRWNETETPVGTFGAGYGGGGAGIAYSPNEETQALYNSFLQALANLRR